MILENENILEISGKPKHYACCEKYEGMFVIQSQIKNPQSCPPFLVARGIFITTKPAKNVKPGRFKERYSGPDWSRWTKVGMPEPVLQCLHIPLSGSGPHSMTRQI